MAGIQATQARDVLFGPARPVIQFGSADSVFRTRGAYCIQSTRSCAQAKEVITSQAKPTSGSEPHIPTHIEPVTGPAGPILSGCIDGIYPCKPTQ